MSQSTIEDIERYSQVMRLDSDPRVGDSIIKLRAVPEGLVGATITIDPVGAHPEPVVVTAVDNRKVTFTPALSYDHTIGVPVQRMDITGGYPSGALNVKNFGAVGDGVTDDTAAIQAAIDAASTLSYGSIYIPRGTYGISSTLTVFPKVCIFGDGFHNTIIKAISLISGAMLQIDGGVGLSAGSILEKLYIDGNSNAETGTDIYRSPDMNILRDLYITGCTAQGLYMRSECWQTLVDACTIRSNARGAYVNGTGGNANAITFRDCNIESNTKAGAWIVAGNGIRFSNCVIQGNGYGGVEEFGVVIEGGTAINFNGTYFENNGSGTSTGIDIDLRTTTYGVYIGGCYFYGGNTYGKHAIQITDSVQHVSAIGSRSWGHADKTINIIGLSAYNITVDMSLADTGAYAGSPNGFLQVAGSWLYNDIIWNGEPLKGPVVTNPDGDKLYRIGVDNSGNLITTLVTI